MAYKFWLEEIPNYKKLCYMKCADDFNPRSAIRDKDFNPDIPIAKQMPVNFQKLEDGWHEMNDMTHVIVGMSTDVGLNRINKQNAHEWLIRLALIQGLHGTFIWNEVPIRALYVAEDFIKEVDNMSMHRAVELSVEAQEKFTELKKLVVGTPKSISIPCQLNPLDIVAHGGYKNNVEPKSFEEFCKELRLKAENMIDENIEAIQKAKHNQDKNKKKRNRKKR